MGRASSLVLFCPSFSAARSGGSGALPAPGVQARGCARPTPLPLSLLLHASPTTEWRALEVGGEGIFPTPADWSRAMAIAAAVTR